MIKIWNLGETSVFYSSEDSLYQYKVYIGKETVKIEKGDSFWFIDEDLKKAFVFRGPKEVKSNHLGILLRGYICPEKTAEIDFHSFLPYVNGCSTRQIFPPERPGDPTWQLLTIPPKTKEQIHHVHSTDRIAFILKGSGKAIFGQKDNFMQKPLKKNSVCYIKSMTAHHFESNEELKILAFHVFSTASSLELNHPMYVGTLPVIKE